MGASAIGKVSDLLPLRGDLVGSQRFVVREPVLVSPKGSDRISQDCMKGVV